MNLKSVLHFSVGPIGSAALGVVTVPIIAWFFMPEDIGRITMLQLITGFSILLFGLGLEQAYVREYHESANAAQLLKNVMAPGLVLLVLVSLLLLSMLNYVSIFLFDIDSMTLGAAVIACVVLSYLSSFFSLILRMKEKGMAYSIGQLLPKFTYLCLVGAYIAFSNKVDFLKLVAAHVSSLVIVCMVYALVTRDEWIAACAQRIELKKIFQMFSYSFPLVFAGLAYWGLTVVDRFFLRNYSTYEELGIYSVATNFAAIAIVFQSIFTTLWAPVVYKWAKTDSDLNRVSDVIEYVLFFVVLIFCMAGLFSWLIKFLLPENYAVIHYIVVASLGGPLLYTLSEATGIGIGLTRRSMLGLAATIVAFLVNVVGNFLLIPHYGASGAAASTCFAFWVFFICRTELSFYAWRCMPRFKLYVFSIACVGLSVYMALSRHIDSYATDFLWFSLLVLLIFFNRKILRSARGFLGALL